MSPVPVLPFEESTLQWEVLGAVAVELLLPDGEQIPVESTGALPVALPVGTHTYELRATNEDGETVSRTQRVVIEEPQGEWQFNSGTDALTGDRKQVLYLFSDDFNYPGVIDFGITKKPVLLIGCDKSGWTVLTTWGEQYIAAGRGGSVAVAYRLDDGGVIESTETQAGPDAVAVNDVEPFVASLLGKAEMVYRVWHYDGSEVGTATFPIAHLEYRIDELSDCSL